MTDSNIEQGWVGDPDFLVKQEFYSNTFFTTILLVHTELEGKYWKKTLNLEKFSTFIPYEKYTADPVLILRPASGRLNQKAHIWVSGLSQQIGAKSESF